MKGIKQIALATGAMLIFCGQAMASPFGIIMDVVGEPVINRGEENITADFGVEIMLGDVLEIGAQQSLVVVAYKTCDEWTLGGTQQALISDPSGIASLSGPISPDKRLPVCYQPESFSYDKSQIIGGTLLRSGGVESDKESEDVTLLREAADRGDISNSGLLGLVVHDALAGNTEQASLYCQQLLKRNPTMTIPDPLAEQVACTP